MGADFAAPAAKQLESLAPEIGACGGYCRCVNKPSAVNRIGTVLIRVDVRAARPPHGVTLPDLLWRVQGQSPGPPQEDIPATHNWLRATTWKFDSGGNNNSSRLRRVRFEQDGRFVDQDAQQQQQQQQCSGTSSSCAWWVDDEGAVRITAVRGTGSGYDGARIFPEPQSSTRRMTCILSATGSSR